jgi:hypothetical protein
MKENLFIEFAGNKIEYNQIFNTLKELWKSQGNKIKDLKNVELYYKPEENTCYYVINSENKGKFVI